MSSSGILQYFAISRQLIGVNTLFRSLLKAKGLSPHNVPFFLFTLGKKLKIKAIYFVSKLVMLFAHVKVSQILIIKIYAFTEKLLPRSERQQWQSTKKPQE